MRTIVFDLGLLGFCVGAVVFSLQGYGVFDVLGRAFIVFIGVVLTGVFSLAASAWFASGMDPEDGTADAQTGQRRDASTAATYQQPAPQAKGGAA